MRLFITCVHLIQLKTTLTIGILRNIFSKTSNADYNTYYQTPTNSGLSTRGRHE